MQRRNRGHHTCLGVTLHYMGLSFPCRATPILSHHFLMIGNTRHLGSWWLLAWLCDPCFPRHQLGAQCGLNPWNDLARKTFFLYQSCKKDFVSWSIPVSTRATVLKGHSGVNFLKIYDADHLTIPPCRMSCEEGKTSRPMVPLDDENLLSKTLLGLPPYLSSATVGVASYLASTFSAAFEHTTATNLPSLVASSETYEASPIHLSWRPQSMSLPGGAHGPWIPDTVDTDHLVGSSGQPKGSLEMPRRFTQWTTCRRTIEVRRCGVTTRRELHLASCLSCYFVERLKLEVFLVFI